MYTTGYYATPGTTKRGKVHILFYGKSICGYRPSKKMIYQWCAQHIEMSYVECKACRERGGKILQASTTTKRRQSQPSG